MLSPWTPILAVPHSGGRSMGGSEEDDKLVLQCSYAGSGITAAILPISLILQSDALYAITVVLYVGVAFAIHGSNGRKLVHASAGCAGAILLVAIPAVGAVEQALVTATLSTGLLAVFLHAGRRLRSLGSISTSSITREA